VRVGTDGEIKVNQYGNDQLGSFNEKSTTTLATAYNAQGKTNYGHVESKEYQYVSDGTNKTNRPMTAPA
jgi:hypothetical protein